MFKIEAEASDYVRITGYADGSDWLMTPGGGSLRARGIVADDYVWFHDERSELRIFSAKERRLTATLNVADTKSSFGRARISLSRDGRRLYVLVRKTEGQVLHIVDPALGRIATTHDGFPDGWQHPVLERPDGTLLVPFQERTNDIATHGLVLFDPANGARAESRISDYSDGHGFESHSPDGRWWLRPDRSALPVLDVNPAFAGRIFGRGPERYYGVTLQLWEAFPLRFARSLTVAWLKLGEMPDETRFAHDDRVPDPDAARLAVWETIAAVTARAGAGPQDEIPRSAFPAQFSAHDREWRDIEENWHKLGRACGSVRGWQPDSQAFWIQTNGFLSCIGVDGAVSPRLYAERKGRQDGRSEIERYLYPQRDGMPSGGWPRTEYPRSIDPLDGRKARVSYVDGYAGGAALFDGSPSTALHRVAAVSKSRDQWVEFDKNQRRGDALALDARVEALKDVRKKGFVPLAAWSEAACIAAIDALIAQIDADFFKRAVDGDIQTVFVMGKEHIDEEQFFNAVRDRFPGAAPAIRRLIERYLDVYTGHSDLTWKGSEGIAIFGHAVRALGVLDEEALPTVRRYGDRVDGGHENFFAHETVPSIVAAHGWTDRVIDFVVAVLLRHYNKGSLHYAEVWNEWGLGEAAGRHTPEAFARRVADQFAIIRVFDDDPGRYGSSGIGRLARELPKPHEPWVAAFLAKMDHISHTDDPAAVGGPFNLVDQHGRNFSDRDVKGRPFLVFFGFTRCRDVSPATLSAMSKVMRALGHDADRVGALFITVDPWRDTPAAMKEYLSKFDPRLRGLTGDHRAIFAVRDAYRVDGHRINLGDDYVLDTTSFVFLMDKGGRFVAPFNLGRRAEDAAAELRKYL